MKDLISLMGQRITVWCMNYIYTGKLTEVNADCIRLENAAVVYETGPFNEKEWRDAQALPNPVYVMLTAVESYMVLK